MGWAVPEVTTGSSEMGPGPCCRGPVPSFGPGDAVTSAPFPVPTSACLVWGDGRRVTAAAADTVNCR